MFLKVSKKKQQASFIAKNFQVKNTEPKLGVSDTTQTQAVNATFGTYLY